ncbi:hypothetical protein K3495_g8472 [Podosphaera aphanis]|nr:hypothetical protein K3495_g8472 [Podosphaera aphanis]
MRHPLLLKNNAKANQYISEDSESFYTDRRYKSRRNNSPKFCRSFKPSSSNSNGQLEKCFICRKYDCWSFNHTDKKREQHRRKWQKGVQKRANRQDDQYLAEGCVNDQPEESSDSEIEALINTIDLGEVEYHQGDTQGTYFGEIDVKEPFHAVADLSMQHANCRPSFKQRLQYHRDTHHIYHVV